MAGDPAKPPLIFHLTISGRVQGVSYRVWLQAEALSRGIRGWTRNRANGDVEALLAGPADAVQALCELCRSGPPMARVDQILVADAEPSALEPAGAANAFAILPTL
jgi:acylphosphatase